MVKRRGGEERKGESWGGGGKFSLFFYYFNFLNLNNQNLVRHGGRGGDS